MSDKAKTLRKKINLLCDDLNEEQLTIIDQAISKVVPKINSLYTKRFDNNPRLSVDYKRNVENYQNSGEWDSFY